MTKESHTFAGIRLAAPDTEWCHSFIQAMANRMSVSYYKYGPVALFDGDCMASGNLRLKKYLETGNTEDLADACNFFMMEAMRHPEAFRATDSDESPGRVWADGSVDQAPNAVR